MREITSEEAKSTYRISTHHHQMQNGERRFRLKKEDGTAYIRTESADAGAWQESHYHNAVLETYIVQKGWIAFASKVHGLRRIALYQEGELFTTQPQVIHNVYMPAGSIIHTVKHGNVVSEDRQTDNETKAFDQETGTLTSEREIEMLDERRMASPDSDDDASSAAFRHYDDLIWRLPVWTTALLSATMVGLNASTQETLQRLPELPWTFYHRPTRCSCLRYC